MKIEESFQDLKDLLSLEKRMNKHQEQMVALVLLAYARGDRELPEAGLWPCPILGPEVSN